MHALFASLVACLLALPLAAAPCAPAAMAPCPASELAPRPAHRASIAASHPPANASRAHEAVEHPELGGLRLNQLQVIGTHNSYKAAIQPELYEIMLAYDANLSSLDYAHPPLADQLDLGVRNLELDVYHDPEGGHYADPMGNRLLRGLGVEPLPYNSDGRMDQPGFKVLHDCNFDFRSNEPILTRALDGLAAWSAANPGHLPVVVTMNLKGGDAPAPGAIDPVEFDTPAMRQLDRVLLEHLGRDNLLTPDDVRGDHASLAAAIEADGWPVVDACRGRFLFVLDHGGGLRDRYVAGDPTLAGRPMFTSGPADAPYGVVLVINDPIGSRDRIERLAARGRLIRTRADAGTREMRGGDRSRFVAAMRSGAHVITTDYPTPDRRHNPRYRVVFEGGDYARANPVTTNADEP